jgi:hypothetical protein
MPPAQGSPPPPPPQLTKIDFRPGINRELTRYANEGGWYDSDYVRFRFGKPEKIGGWVNIQGSNVSGSVLGKARVLKGWNSLDGSQWMAIGTNLKLYIWQGGTYTDITPVRVSASTTNPFNTSAGSVQVKVSISAHGAIDGDFFVITSTAATVGGNIVLSGGYQLSVLDTNSFTINTTTTAAATSVACGGPTTGFFEINTGNADNTQGTGWGVSSWGGSTWGTARSGGSNIFVPLRTWSLDNWGENLLANPTGGAIYQWVKTSGVSTRAVVLSSAPSQANFILVSQEDQHAIAFGVPDVITSVYDPLYLRWCTQGDLTSWAATPTNDAGDKRLSGANRITAVHRSRGQILIWTDDPLFSMQDSGPPYTFTFQNIGQGCGIVGPNAVIDAGGFTFWMGNQQFMVYSGAAPVPLPCTVLRYVFDSLDTTQLNKVFAAANASFNEVIWFYQSTASTTGEIDRCVAYNYIDNTWWIGSLSRLSWIDRGTFPQPIAFDSSGVGYYQEFGFDADGAAIDSYIESNEFDLGDGQNIMFLDRIIPDDTDRDGNPLNGNISLYVNYRAYPGDTLHTKGPYLVSANTAKVDLRVRGRQLSLRVESTAVGQSWRLGSYRFRQAPDGEH